VALGSGAFGLGFRGRVHPSAGPAVTATRDGDWWSPVANGTSLITVADVNAAARG
jgi:hypothetical protein